MGLILFKIYAEIVHLCKNFRLVIKCAESREGGRRPPFHLNPPLDRYNQPQGQLKSSIPRGVGKLLAGK